MVNRIEYIDTALTGAIVDIHRLQQTIDMMGKHLQAVSERVTILEDCQEGTDNLLNQMNDTEQHIVVTEHPEMK